MGATAAIEAPCGRVVPLLGDLGEGGAQAEEGWRRGTARRLDPPWHMTPAGGGPARRRLQRGGRTCFADG